MCGIGLLVFSESEDSSDLEDKLKRCLTLRGPSIPCQKKTMKTSPTTGFDETTTSIVELYSSVLHLRGTDPMKQPVMSKTTGFCWNGEIYHSLNHNISTENTEVSDTEIINGLLVDSYKDNGIEHIAKVFSEVDGEYAFIYVHQPISSTNNNGFKDETIVYFGRDPFGRRSLLSTPFLEKDERGEITDKMKALDSKLDKFMLCSTSPFDYYGEDEQDQEQKNELMEVPAGFVFAIHIKSGIIEKHPILKKPAPEIIASFSSENSNVTMGGNDEMMLDLYNKNLSSSKALLSKEEISNSMLQAAETLFLKLSDSVRKRVINVPLPSSSTSSSVAILFSGGIDSVILAALSHFHIPIDQSIDLLNVAFCTPSLDGKMMPEELANQSKDRVAAIESYLELKQIYNQRKWNFVRVDVDLEELLHERPKIYSLLYPRLTNMDLNVGSAMWFAGRGKGWLCSDDGTESIPYHSNTKVLILGIGADEQLGGYSRHRAVFNKTRSSYADESGEDMNSSLCIEKAYIELEKELRMEMRRIWQRNLGRDDRILSSHGKESRFPFLDEDVVLFLSSQKITDYCDFSKGPGIGDKMILRIIAKGLGLTHCVCLVKRAMQFGSRVAKTSDVHTFGSRHKASGTAGIIIKKKD